MTDNTARIIELFNEYWARDGEIELYDGECDGISENSDNGAYVLAWVWVDFAGTDLDGKANA